MVELKLTTLLALVGCVSGAAIEKRATCTSYTLINTRGTGEPQGESAGFTVINQRVLAALPGGKRYNTVYPAAADQNSEPGTQDIVRKITSTLLTKPNECFILEGYSQGATATVNALPRLTGPAFSAVRGVFLIGDPLHHPNLPPNVDQFGGTTTRSTVGILDAVGIDIPSAWYTKTRDVCIARDNVCDFFHGTDGPHLQYPTDVPTQNLGFNFITASLR